MPVLLKHQPWNDGSDEEGDVEVEWNLWRTRQRPYQELEPGVPVVLVSGGGPREGLLTWEVEVLDVVKEPYTSHEAAWRLLGPLARPCGVVKRVFLEQSYTTGAAEQGWLLAWTYRPVRLINQPRPADLRFQPNGWAVTEGLTVGDGAKQGQGRLRDPLLRRTVELAAMRVVRDWLRGQGHPDSVIRDTSAGNPYDYEVCPAGAAPFRVEVKGTSGGRGPVIVTAGEVAEALRAREAGVRTVLAVVHDIELTLGDDRIWTAQGGVLWVDEDWCPDAASLDVLQYRHRPNYG